MPSPTKKYYWYISLLEVEVLLLKALFCKQKLVKLQPKKKKKECKNTF